MAWPGWSCHGGGSGVGWEGVGKTLVEHFYLVLAEAPASMPPGGHDWVCVLACVSERVVVRGRRLWLQVLCFI